MKKTILILVSVILLNSCSKESNKHNLLFKFKNKSIELTNVKKAIIMNKAFIYGQLIKDTSIRYEISQIDFNTAHIYSSKRRSNDMNNEDFLKGQIEIKGDNIFIDIKSDNGSHLFIQSL